MPRPAYTGSQEGKIVVRITVDKTGTVIGTAIDKGTTISEESLRENCKTAARQVKFSSDADAQGNAVGTITYNFKLQ